VLRAGLVEGADLLGRVEADRTGGVVRGGERLRGLAVMVGTDLVGPVLGALVAGFGHVCDSLRFRGRSARCAAAGLCTSDRR
jgi:hypothetical protein